MLIRDWGKCRGGLSSCIRHFLTPAYSILQLDAICFVWFIFVVNGTRSFATVFTKYRHWTPSSTRWVKVTTAGRVLFLDFLILSPPVNTDEQVDGYFLKAQHTHIVYTLTTRKKFVKIAEPNPTAISVCLMGCGSESWARTGRSVSHEIAGSISGATSGAIVHCCVFCLLPCGGGKKQRKEAKNGHTSRISMRLRSL